MGHSVVYIMKIKGVNNMPDSIQVRDADFTLIGYYRADKPETAKALLERGNSEAAIKEIVAAAPYGRLIEFSTEE